MTLSPPDILSFHIKDLNIHAYSISVTFFSKIIWCLNFEQFRHFCKTRLHALVWHRTLFNNLRPRNNYIIINTIRVLLEYSSYITTIIGSRWPKTFSTAYGWTSCIFYSSLVARHYHKYIHCISKHLHMFAYRNTKCTSTFIYSKRQAIFAKKKAYFVTFITKRL